MKNIFVKVSTFYSAAMVPTDFVTSVDAAHKSVVVDDGHGTWDREEMSLYHPYGTGGQYSTQADWWWTSL